MSDTSTIISGVADSLRVNMYVQHMYVCTLLQDVPPPSPDDAGLILLGRGK
jgi:hypothetical protein